MNHQPQTLNQAILTAMDCYAASTCFKIKQGNKPFQDISYKQFQIQTLCLAYFFYQQGVNQGERVAIVANNSLEWMVAHIACLLAGGVVVPVRISLPPDMIHYILKDSAATVVIVDNDALDYMSPALGKSLPHLKTVISINDTLQANSMVTPLETILRRSLTANEQQTIQDFARNIKPKALAAIHYTASETGQPKGAVFTQAQRWHTMQHLAQWLIFEEEELLFTTLLWGSTHSLNIALHAFLAGVPNALSQTGPDSLEGMRQTSPTLILLTPWAIEGFYNQVMSELSQWQETNQEVFQWALNIGRAYQAAGDTASERLRQAYKRADLTFFSQLRGRAGGQLRRLYYTGTTMPHWLADFIEVIGPAPLNIYSITEAGGFPAISQLTARRPGSCGQIAPGFQIRIADDGEILVKAPTVMQGYWQQPEETQQVIDSEGWLHTGDLGRFDQDGFLYLTGRKEALIVLSSGRKVMPSIIENALKESPYVAQAAVFGEGRAYLSALIVPDLESMVDHFQDNEPETPLALLPDSDSVKWFWQTEDEHTEPIPITAHAWVKLQLDKVVQEVNSRLDRWEQIKRYSLLDQAYSRAADDLADLSPTKRQEITRRYAVQIDMMYPQISRLKEKEITQVRVTPQRMRDLLEKERILDAWMADAGIEFLFDLARQKEIDGASMVNLCDIAASIAQMENEARPLSTAIIVGNPGRITRVLPPSQIQLLGDDYHIRRMRKVLVTMAVIVDGMSLGYVIDKHGYVRGVHRLDMPLNEPSTHHLLGPQFRRHAAISAICDALVFFVPTGGRQVRVFADGQLVGRYSNGDWSPESIVRIDEVIAGLAWPKAYELSLVQRVLRCAFRMSEENLGAIFVMGNADDILERSDAPEIGHFALILTTDIAALSDEELINFAKQDGATLIDVQGKFRGCMILLRPNANTRAEIGPGKGARHSSAAKMSAEAACLAITISQDGPITIYNNGQRVLSL
jgi:long-chain acyl-CoA synthetase